MVNGMIRIKESDPPSKVFLTPTVPVSCPPCTMTLGLARSVGLDLSECSVTFSGVDGEPDASQTVMIEPMNTYGSSSRVARIEFSPITTDPVSPWDGYTPAHCPVCSRLHLLFKKGTQKESKHNKDGERPNNRTV